MLPKFTAFVMSLLSWDTICSELGEIIKANTNLLGLRDLRSLLCGGVFDLYVLLGGLGSLRNLLGRLDDRP